jgi:hypothetical protein
VSARRRDPLWHSIAESASFWIGTLPVRAPALATRCDPRDGVPESQALDVQHLRKQQ